MRTVLGVSTALGLIGVVAAFGLFYLAERVFHFDRAHAQTMMYLKLSVAGHLTIFLARTRGPFWSIRPAKILWIAVLGTQIVATLFAVYGFLMAPLGWGWALFVWGYALAWFLVNDRVKLLAYWIFDRPTAKAKADAVFRSDEKAKTHPVTKPDAKVEPKPELQAAAKSDTGATSKPRATGALSPRAQSEPTLEANAKPTADLTPRIVERAYELYEDGGRKDGAAVQNWEKAESEIRKDLAGSGLPDETTAVLEPEAADHPRPVAKMKPQAQVKASPMSEMQLEAKVETPSDVPPQLVKRVHELYEQLGRQDVRAVEEWEKAQAKIRQEQPAK
jgi:H+-transporting ATPase